MKGIKIVCQILIPCKILNLIKIICKINEIKSHLYLNAYVSLILSPFFQCTLFGTLYYTISLEKKIYKISYIEKLKHLEEGIYGTTYI